MILLISHSRQLLRLHNGWKQSAGRSFVEYPVQNWKKSWYCIFCSFRKRVRDRPQLDCETNMETKAEDSIHKLRLKINDTVNVASWHFLLLLLILISRAARPSSKEKRQEVYNIYPLSFQFYLCSTYWTKTRRSITTMIRPWLDPKNSTVS